MILIALGVLAVTMWPARQLGTEFMPNLNEGTLLLHADHAARHFRHQGRPNCCRCRTGSSGAFPEVASVYGKAGRAATATDPAPTEMFETIINLKPKAEWRAGLTLESLTAEMDKALQFPGVSNAWTQPIKARIDMLSTGIRTPIGVKVIGTDLVEIDRLAKQVEQVLRAVPGTSSAYAERGIGGYYLDIVPDRAALARYGIMIQDVQDVIATALGGQTVTTTVEGRQRFSVNMRYPRDLRSDPHVDRARGAGADARGRGGAAGRGRKSRAGARADLDPDRERTARGLCLCRYQGPRHRRLCRRRASRP